MPPQRISRRYFLRLAGASAATLGANGVWGWLVEPHLLAVERVEIRLPRLPAALDGFSIGQISDIHYGVFIHEAEVNEGVSAMNALRPDVVVLTGDFVLEVARHAQACARLLTRLQAPHGVHAILGNHDHWTHAPTVIGALREAGFDVLLNQSVAIERGGARLWLAGVDDVWERHADLERALAGIPAGETTVLLAHEPDFADFASNYPVDLQLSGHSHGGQVRLPLVGAVALPYLGQKYSIGLNYAGRLPVYTSRGLGMIGPPVRWNCRPEVTLLTLRAQG